MNADFWSVRGRTETVRALLQMLLGRHGTSSVERLLEALKQDRGIPGDELPSPRALRNFLEKGATPRNSRYLGHVLRWGVETVRRLSLTDIEAHPSYAAAVALSESLDAERRPPNDHPIPSTEGMNLLRGVLGLEVLDVERWKEALFGRENMQSSERRERHYHCYRYHSKPGFVVKSFLAVVDSPPNVADLCTFAAFLRVGHGRSVQKSNGLVLPMQKATYFVGQVERNAGLSMTVVPDLDKGMTSYPGLTLATDEDFSPVMARCVLVPTTATNHAEAGSGIATERALESEIAPIRPQLRNRVEFTLNEQLLLDGKAISQNAMVAMVEQLLTNADHKPRLTYASSGEAFNPAAGVYYTFNAAVRFWTAAEWD
jgi:hypothetical protein